MMTRVVTPELSRRLEIPTINHHIYHSPYQKFLRLLKDARPKLCIYFTKEEDLDNFYNVLWIFNVTYRNERGIGIWEENRVFRIAK